jgi:hypothetical protein
MKKEDYLKLLRQDETYKKCLSSVKDENERRLISAYTEDFMMKFYSNIIDPLSNVLEKDPEALKKACMEIENKLINDLSGSQDVKKDAE